MRKKSIIALMTDFGLSDGYVASMKGIIFAINPLTQIIDITHLVQPQSISQAAFLLWSCYKFFPPNTIFVCVVDPGVGSSRKIICVEGDGYRFLAPDNGVLKYIFASTRISRIVTVSNSKYYLKNVCTTFHGRDVFAPVAAYLSKGVSLSTLGQRAKPEFGAENFIDIVPGQKKIVKGKIIHIDRFGNIITNFHLREPPGKFFLEVGRTRISDVSLSYMMAKSENPFMILGSSGLLEVSQKNYNVARKLRAKIDQKIQLKIL